MSLNRVLREPAAGKSGLSGMLRRPVGGACSFWRNRKGVSGMMKKLLVFLLLVLVSSLICSGALAAGETRTVTYLDREGKTETAVCSVLSSAEGDVTLSPGWYTVTENAEITGSLSLPEGDYHLVLCDGASLTIRRQICGYGSNSANAFFGDALTVYAGRIGTGKIAGTGALRVERNAENWSGDLVQKVGFVLKELTICGGRVENTATEDLLDGTGFQYLPNGGMEISGDITVIDGKVQINGEKGISASGTATITGGELVIDGCASLALNASNLLVEGGTLSCTGNVSTTVTVSNLTVMDGFFYARSANDYAISCRTASFQGGIIDLRGGWKAFEYDWFDDPEGNNFSLDGVAVSVGEGKTPVSADERISTIKSAQTVYIKRCEDPSHENGGVCPYCGAEKRKITYRRLDGGTGSALYTPVSADDAIWTTGWYAVTEDVTLNERVAVEGDVHLILCDGAKLTAPKGISVTEFKSDSRVKNSLTIWDQGKATGQLTAGPANDYFAAIGGNYNIHNKNSGIIVINGGNIYAVGGKKSAGIGGGANEGGGGCGYVTINRGNVTAAGVSGGAGIGSSHHNGYSNVININGGTVKAIGRPYDENELPAGSAIGGGIHGTCGTIMIRGGIIEAEVTGAGGAAIGSGGDEPNPEGDPYGDNIITISGGTINASCWYEGAGIGGGRKSKGGTVIINGGKIDSAIGVSGIGNGENGSGWNVSIRGGSVTAEGGEAGIDVTGGSIEFRNATITAAVADESATKTIHFPKSLKQIGNYAFKGDKFSLLEIPETCKEIGYCAFQDADIKKIHIPAGCAIDGNAFSGSTGAIKCSPVYGPAPGGG